MAENYNTGTCTIKSWPRLRVLELAANSPLPCLFAIVGQGERVSSGRACCGMRRSTNRILNRLPRSFSARVASINVLHDLPAVSGGVVVAEAWNSSWC